MKRIAIVLSALMLQSCATTYYTYYEVDSPDTATIASLTDASWQTDKKSPTRCVAAYPDSTGHIVYLMESKTKE